MKLYKEECKLHLEEKAYFEVLQAQAIELEAKNAKTMEKVKQEHANQALWEEQELKIQKLLKSKLKYD